MTEQMNSRVAQKLFGREQSYWTALITLWIYNLGVASIGAAFIRVTFPIDESQAFYWSEGLVFALMALSSIGMILHALNAKVTITRWSFLASFSGATIAFVTFLGGSGTVSGFGTIGISLLILAGAFVAFSMHMEHGGRIETRKIKGGSNE